MNAIGKVTDAITHPLQTAGSVTSQAVGLTKAGVRTSARVIGWAVNQGRSAPRDAAGSPPVTVVPPVADEAAGSATPRTSTDTAAVERAPRKKAPVKRAPSAKAATAGPALAGSTKEEDEGIASNTPSAEGSPSPGTGETALSSSDTETLLDPSTAKAVRSEAEMMRKASDPNKG